MMAYARGSPCRQPSCPGGPIAAGARCLSLLKVVNTGAPKIPHHESWSPGDACTKPRRAFNSLLEKEPKSGKSPGQARPAGPSGHQLDPNRTSPPALPHAALGYYDNGSAGCPRPRKRVDGGGQSMGLPTSWGRVRQPSSPAGGSPGRRCGSSWWTRRRRAQPRAPILCPPIGMLERRRSRSAQGRATREAVLRDGHQCLLFHGYQSLNTLAAAPERDAGQVD